MDADSTGKVIPLASMVIESRAWGQERQVGDFRSGQTGFHPDKGGSNSVGRQRSPLLRTNIVLCDMEDPI